MGIIEIRNLTKTLGRKKILKEISFQIEKGEILGLVGKSGAGKSVLIKILIGFFKPDTGDVFIEQNCSLGYSMQENAIYEYMTAYQNLDYFATINNIKKKERTNIINSLIQSLNLQDYKKVLVKNLSGGTKKRVDLACSLLTHPDILILDEPLLGLDPGLVKDLSEFIINLNKKGTTIIISSHQIEELSRICSRLMLLEEGKVYSIKKENLKEVYK